MRGANVSDRDSKSRAQYLRAGAVVLAIGVGGIAWAGCGDDDNGNASDAQQRIEKGFQEARQGVEEGVKEAKKGIERGTEGAREGINKGKEEAESGVNKAKEEAEEGFEEAQDYGAERAP